MKKINMAEPYFDHQDRKWIHDELDNILNGLLSMGPNVATFEAEFSNYLNCKHAIAVDSCTSALEISLNYFDIKGTEVIVPAQTFIATGMAVHLAGGIPVFADICPETFSLSLDSIKRKISEKTVGLIIVHFAGIVSPEYQQIYDFCKDNGLFIVEDAAHAPGAQYNGKFTGTLGDVGCFSFFPSKVITSGEGGMLTTNNDKIAMFARSHQSRGRDMSQADELYSLPGRNVRLSEFNALIGRCQLRHLEEYIAARRALAYAYYKGLSNCHFIQLVSSKVLGHSVFWKFPILLKSAKAKAIISKALKMKNIASDSAYNPPLHLQPVMQRLFNTKQGNLPITEDLLTRHLNLPVNPRMSQEDVCLVVDTILSCSKQL